MSWPGLCPDTRYSGKHSLVLTYYRPPWRMFRKTFIIRCWHCDLRIVEPSVPGDRAWR